VDAIFTALTLTAVIFSGLIFAAIIILAARYRTGARVDRSNAPTHSNLVEAIWTFIPLGILMTLFAWSSIQYFTMIYVPKGGIELHVVGKQWMWKIQHPSGRWENNELHIPVGRPVVLSMISEDVIHAFFIPAFRVKQDVMPGQFTRMWFTATKPGVYHLFCAEFCGTDHSRMTGTVTVMEPADYERWLREGSGRQSAAAEGAKLFRDAGCSGCHGAQASVRAPSLEGIYGRPVPVQIPKVGVPLEQTPATTVVADTRYIHDAIMLPENEVAAGFKPIMPTFKNRLTEEQVLKLIAYLRSLRGAAAPETRQKDYNTNPTEEDYRARAGFVPDNMQQIRSGNGGQ
jgi:cytochrome c oxidase subunit 2